MEDNQGSLQGDVYEAALEAGLAEFANVATEESGETPEVSSQDQPSEESESDQLSAESETESKEEQTPTDPEEILKLLEGEEDNPEEAEKAESDQPETESKEGVQKFTLTVNGESIEKELSTDQLIAELQIAHNYTQSKQELTSSIKEKEAELEKYESELNEKIETAAKALEGDLEVKERWDSFIEYMKSNNPEWHEDLVTDFRAYQAQFENPIVKAQLSKLESIEKQLNETQEAKKAESKKAELIAIAEQYSKEMEKVKSDWLPQFKKLGITFNEEKIKTMWTEKGYPTVQSAFHDAYKDLINKRYSSLDKVNKTAVKTSKKSPTVAGKNRSSVSLPEGPKNPKSYEDITEYFVSGEGSKAFG